MYVIGVKKYFICSCELKEPCEGCKKPWNKNEFAKKTNKFVTCLVIARTGQIVIKKIANPKTQKNIEIGSMNVNAHWVISLNQHMR